MFVKGRLGGDNAGFVSLIGGNVAMFGGYWRGTLEVRYEMSDIRFQMSDIRRKT